MSIQQTQQRDGIIGMTISIDHQTDIFGNTIRFESRNESNSGDLTSYQSGSIFNQRDGCTFDDDETGLADSAYTGATNIRPTSKNYESKFSATEYASIRATGDYELVEWMHHHDETCGIIRVCVEQNIRCTKRFNYAGDAYKCKHSLIDGSVSLKHHELYYKLAAYLAISK